MVTGIDDHRRQRRFHEDGSVDRLFFSEGARTRRRESSPAPCRGTMRLGRDAPAPPVSAAGSDSSVSRNRHSARTRQPTTSIGDPRIVHGEDLRWMSWNPCRRTSTSSLAVETILLQHDGQLPDLVRVSGVGREGDDRRDRVPAGVVDEVLGSSLELGQDTVDAGQIERSLVVTKVVAYSAMRSDSSMPTALRTPPSCGMMTLSQPRRRRRWMR